MVAIQRVCAGQREEHKLNTIAFNDPLITLLQCYWLARNMLP